jgi:hypothetical protein
MEKYNYAASWLLQGALHGDSDCIEELDRYEEYTSDPEWIATWLDQRKQYQAAIDYEDGRLTFPFSQSNSENYKSEGNLMVPFEDRCTILGQFWYEFRDEDGEMSDFIRTNDVGLPLAWFISTGAVKSLEMGEEFVNETFSLFLESMNLKESELIGIDNLGSLLDIVKRRNQND